MQDRGMQWNRQHDLWLRKGYHAHGLRRRDRSDEHHWRRGSWGHEGLWHEWLRHVWRS
jgi:hypothetical protein